MYYLTPVDGVLRFEICGNLTDPPGGDKIFFSKMYFNKEVTYRLCGNVNSYNTRAWQSETFHAVTEG
jgi:hypothetical protein